MKERIDDYNEDDDYNFFCFPSFHAFWKLFPKIKPFLKKGALHSGDWISWGARTPITRVKRDQKNYNITMEIPGILRDEINLEATNDELWFSAQSTEFKFQFKHHIHFKKRIRPNEIRANLKAGILTITAPFLNNISKTKVDVE